MPIKIDSEAFYTIGDLAEVLKKSPLTARRYCREGKIPGSKKVGREWIILGKGIIAYLSTDRGKKRK